MAFTFVVLFVVLVFWRPQEWLLPWLYGLPILDVVAGLAVFGVLIEITDRRISVPRVPHAAFIIGVWIATMVSHIAHTYLGGMIVAMTYAGKMCLFGFLVMCVIDRVSRAQTMAVLIVAMISFMAVHALMQEHLGYGFTGQRPIAYRGWMGEAYTRTQFFGIFEDPNDLAQMMAVGIPLAFAVPRRMTIGGLLGGGLVALLLVLAIFTTRSRGGMVALITVGAATLALGLPSRWVPLVLGIVMLGALAIAAQYGGRMLDASAYNRVIQWGEANQIFKQNILFGIGFGMFVDYFGLGTHNSYVLCYTELGLFGYWFWFGLVLLCVVGCWRARLALARPATPEARYMRRLAGLCLVSMLGFCSSSYFLNRAWVYPLFFLFALLGAVPAITQDLLPKDAPPLMRPRKDMVLVTVCSLTSVVYIYVSILILNRVA
ncbi:MAG: O-antigen ligase family protein [Kiritimatiellae bacterium]|nr:O-antigen ligase family protein [Kiritimatiellia bacterium]